MNKFQFESLNGETQSKVKGGKNENGTGLNHGTLHTGQTTTDHACGRHGCGASSGLLITD